MNRQKPDNLLYMLALAGGMEGLSQNPLLMSQLLRQGGGSQSNMLGIVGSCFHHLPKQPIIAIIQMMTSVLEDFVLSDTV
jgi:hypothetical protein